MAIEIMTEATRRTAVPGDALTFGRSGGGSEVEIGSDERLHRRCGRVIVEPDGWRLENLGSWLHLRVESLDSVGCDELAPGEVLRVPWPRVSVSLTTGSQRHCFLVDAPAGAQAAADADADAASARDCGPNDTRTPIRIDRASGSFRALVSLCEPRLRDPRSVDVPTDLAIALRLNRSGAEARRLTGKTVERRLDHCRSRFGLKHVSEDGSSAGLERRDARRVLLDAAIASGTVTLSDLRLLDPDDGE